MKKCVISHKIISKMSIVQFIHLTKDEADLLFHAPALVTCLIAGAEDNFNIEEEERSKHLVRIRSNTGDPILFDYYKEVEKNFDEQINALVNKYGTLQATPRTEILVSELSKLSAVLPKMDGLFARAYIKSLRTLAHAVAESSGGILGFLAVSYEEQHLLGLKMVTFE